MDKVLYALLPVLGCAVMMGAMMWLMMRGNHNNGAQPQPGETQDEIARLRAEVALLREEHKDTQRRDGSPTTGGTT